MQALGDCNEMTDGQGCAQVFCLAAQRLSFDEANLPGYSVLIGFLGHPHESRSHTAASDG